MDNILLFHPARSSSNSEPWSLPHGDLMWLPFIQTAGTFNSVIFSRLFKALHIIMCDSAKKVLKLTCLPLIEANLYIVNGDCIRMMPVSHQGLSPRLESYGFLEWCTAGRTTGDHHSIASIGASNINSAVSCSTEAAKGRVKTQNLQFAVASWANLWWCLFCG